MKRKNVYVYRYTRGYGDGLLFSLKDEGFFVGSDDWVKLGVFSLPIDFLKALGWREGEDYVEVTYYE